MMGDLLIKPGKGTMGSRQGELYPELGHRVSQLACPCPRKLLRLFLPKAPQTLSPVYAFPAAQHPPTGV